MKAMSSDVRHKIQMYVKNGLDISDLIRDTVIKGENLSFAKIKDLHRISEDLSGTNFFKTVIGAEGKITSFIGCQMPNCNFEKAQFLGKTLVHKCNCRGCIFRDTFVPYAEYRFTDFTGATFCHAIFKIGSEEGIGCKFDVNFFKDLTKNWGVDVEVRQKGV